MSILKIGKVRPTYKGEWNAETDYEAMDWVLYRGIAYQALGEVTANHEPDVNPDYWVQTGMKGDKGDKGDIGERGPAGVDGRDGADGIQGAVGPSPAYKWDGSKLSVQNPDGTWPEAGTDLRGPQGTIGPQGIKGEQGIPGPVGPQGPQGSQGVQGPKGDTPALSDSVSSTDQFVAASSLAVKTAYDRAAAADAAIPAGVRDRSWNYAGQGGQPSWLWGTNDGANMLVWNPAAFSVNYANSANYANSCDRANSAGRADSTGWADGAGNINGASEGNSSGVNTSFDWNSGRVHIWANRQGVSYSLIFTVHDGGGNRRQFMPAVDGQIDLGFTGERWRNIYGINGQVTTSDSREKTRLAQEFPQALLKAWAKVNFAQYQMNEAIMEKGIDKARVHTGLLAQAVKEALESEGLDSGRYGLFCYDEWEEREEISETYKYEVAPAEFETKEVEISPAEFDQEGKIVKPAVTISQTVEVKAAVYEERSRILATARPAGNRYSLRYEEALCLEAAYQRGRVSDLEAQVESLSATLVSALERISVLEAASN